MATVNKIMKTFNVPNGSDVVCYEIVDDKGRKAIAKDWASNSTAAYDVGEYTMKDGVVYRFKVPHKANTAWNASEVDATNLGAELTSFHGDMKALDGKKANADSMFLYKSAIPGSVVEVEDAVAECVKQMQIEIAPVQDLHGYGKPWVGGAEGEDISGGIENGGFDTSNVNNVATSRVRPVNQWIEVVGGEKYTVTGSTSVSGKTLQVSVWRWTDKTATATSDNNWHNLPYTETLPSGTKYARVLYKFSDESNITASNISGAKFYKYENICPISGHTGCEIVRTGKNLVIQENIVSGKIVTSDGSLSDNSSYYGYSAFISVEPSTPYTLSALNIHSKGNPSDTTSAYVNVAEYSDANVASFLRRVVNSYDANVSSYTFTTGADAHYIRFSVGIGATNIQFEEGSAATAFEPYGKTFTIQFPSPTPGTVYGGTLTLNQDGTGILSVDRVERTLNGTEQWLAISSGQNKYFRITLGSLGSIIDNNIICDKYGRANITSSTTDIGVNVINSSIAGYAIFMIRPKDAGNYTETTFANLLASDNVSFVYKLASASTYQLTTDQVHLLLGYNTLYASTGSILSMLYPTSQVEAVANAKADGILESSSTPSAVMSFSDGADGIPMGVEVAIEPVQDLHGYDKPWVGGAGKNILSWLGSKLGTSEVVSNVTVTYNQDGTIKLNGTANSGDNIWLLGSSSTVWTLPAGSYAAFNTTNVTDAKLQLRNVANTANVFSTSSNGTFTLSETTECCPRIRFENGASFSNVTIYPMIALQSTALTIDDYEPYENICPISGFDHAEVTRTGKNLVDISEISYNKYLNGTGSLEVNNDCYVTGYIHFFAGQKIYIPATGTARRCTYDKNKKFVSYLNISTAQVLNPNFEGYLRVSSRYDTLAVENIQIEYGESATEYETPDIKHYSIAFHTSAGTVYGGTLKVNKDGSGVLSVDWAKRILQGGSEKWDKNEGTTKPYFVLVIGDKGSIVDNVCKSDRFSMELIDSTNTMVGIRTVNSNARNSACVFCRPVGVTIDTTTQEFKTWLASNNVTLVYQLSSAATYSIPAPIIKSLLGQNNLWSSTGNVNSAEWSADTKSYIDNLFSSITSAEGQTF